MWERKAHPPTDKWKSIITLRVKYRSFKNYFVFVGVINHGYCACKRSPECCFTTPFTTTSNHIKRFAVFQLFARKRALNWNHKINASEKNHTTKAVGVNTSKRIASYRYIDTLVFNLITIANGFKSKWSFI